MNTKITNPFEFDPGYVAVQCLSLLLLCVLFSLNIRMTKRVLKYEKGPAAPIWIIAIWLLPIIGAVCASSLKQNDA